MSKIVCIGSLAKDIFFPTPEGKIIENPDNPKEKELIAFEFGAKYQIEDRFEALGGCAANVSLGLARLGQEVSALGRVGKDDLGREIIDALKENKVDTQLVQVDSEAKSDLSLILVDKRSGERTIFFNRDANENLKLENESIQGNYFLVSALNGDWKENIDLIKKAVDSNGAEMIYNPGQANMKEDLEKVREIVSFSKVLILNLDEAIEILGEEKGEEEMLRGLSAMGPETVAITLGEKGAVAFSKGETVRFQSLSVEALDSTGAGDAFISAFSAAYISGKNLDECVKRGILNGANVVQFYGASQGLLTEEEIQEKLKSF